MKKHLAALLFLAVSMPAAPVRADLARQILDHTGVTGGLVVVIGCEDADLLTAFGEREAFTVQGLDADSIRVAKARKLIRSKNLYGKLSADTFDGQSLPYLDNLVNLLVVENARSRQQLSDAEIMRVLAPGGVAYISGEKLVKPWPETMDEWSHFLHDASGNPVSSDQTVGSPRGLRWSAGPLWGRSHEFNNSMIAMVTAKGKLFYIFDFGQTGMEDPRLPERWTLVARDAFNGALLWQRPLQNWGSDVWKSRALRVLGGTLARRLTASGDKLYCTLDFSAEVQILDAATGDTLAVIPNSANTLEIVAGGNQVFCVGEIQSARKGGSARIVCYDTETAQVAWQATDQAVVTQLFCLSQDAAVYHNRQEVVCLNRTGGTVRWRFKPKPAAVEPAVKSAKKRNKGNPNRPAMVLIAGDKVILATAKQLTALALTDGKPLWTSQRQGGNSMREQDVFFSQDRIWCSGDGGAIVGYDIQTGEQAAAHDVSTVQSPGHHLRCYRAKATGSHLITQFRGVEFLSLTGDSHRQNDWMRGACTYGVMPANGLLYQPPHSCFCFAGAMLKGLNALASVPAQMTANQPQPGPLEKGPAYDSAPSLLPDAQSAAAAAWPMYRRDPGRTAATTQTLPQDIGESWKIALGTRLTPPVCAHGRVYVAARDQHTIHALDANGGATLWEFVAGGRIDSPPSIHGGMLVFGCADGYLYCVSASGGQLIWRRRLAPAHRMLVAGGQVESVWRLHGSVAIEGDLAYCSAGRSTFLDGGLFLYAVDIASGEIKHHGRVDTSSETRVDNAADEFVPAYHIEGGNSDLLVAAGGYFYINQMKFSPELERLPAPYLSKQQMTAQPAINLDGKSYVNEDIFTVTWKKQVYDTFEKMADIIVDENKNLGERDLGLHLFSTSGFLDDTFFNRTYWMYSKTWSGFNHSIFAPKSGQLLVMGPRLTYALKAYTSRYALSPRYDPETKGYLIVADLHDNEPTLHPESWGKDKGMGYTRAAPPVWHRWLPVRVNAMVLAGDTLYVCGPPDKVAGDDPMASFAGRMGSELWALNADTGEVLRKNVLSEAPAFDAMIAAEGRLFMSTSDGSLLCWAKD